MKVKLLSLWVGPLPPWMPKFEAQMRRFETVEWELVKLEGRSRAAQIGSLNALASSRLGFPCQKGHSANSVCDFRPAYADLFPEQYEGCDWWGWCDLDVVFGDLDSMLPAILVDGVEALSFKDRYLSGCCAVFRNSERMRGMYRHGDPEKVLSDERYHCWDESGYHEGSGEGFFHLMERHGVAMEKRSDLYLYDSPQEKHGVRWDGSKLFCPKTGNEAALFHFMSDVWPENVK